MRERDVVGQKKQEKTNQSRRVSKQNPQLISKDITATEISSFLYEPTPFNAPIKRHLELLSVASPEQREIIARKLQQTYGNKYMQRLIKSLSVQTKLTINDPGDMHEQEADRIADAVIRSMNNSIETQIPEEELQTQPVGDNPSVISNELEAQIGSRKGNGHPLPDNVREPMERTFQADFSTVQVHTDSEADMLNKQLGARAFTTGQDIFFREGEYSPLSDSGRKLIAHELTHVVQQSMEEVAGDRNGVTIKPLDNVHEQETRYQPTEETIHNTQVSEQGGSDRIIGQKDTLQISHSKSLFVQRTAGDLVNESRRAPQGANQCHEAVLYWLIKAEKKKRPKKLLAKIRNSTGRGQVTGNWMLNNIYTTSTPMTQATLATNLTAGDIVWTGRGTNPIHSMVVVTVNAAPGHVSIRGFNNFGTFGPPSPQLEYDDNDKNIDPNNLWHANDTFGGYMSTEPMYRVQYATAAAGLNAYLLAQGWTYSFWHGWH